MPDIGIDLGEGKQKALVGIDLGTTYCVVTTMEAGNVDVMSDDAGQRTTPSVVFFPDEEYTLEKAIAGWQAERSLIGHPERAVRFIKRYMGRKKDNGEKWMAKVGTVQFSPEQISSVILKKLTHDAEECLFEGENEVTDAVITVPAWFGPAERSATEEAARLAGLTVRALIPEPVAAAVDYATSQRLDLLNKTVFVFDLGGGTFDATIVRIERESEDGPREFWVHGKDGSITLGGADWDKTLAEYVADDFAEHHDGKTPKKDIAAWDRLLITCEEQKRVVSQREPEEAVDFTFHHEGTPHTVSVTRAQFDEMTRPLLDEALNKSAQLAERIQQARCLAGKIADELAAEGKPAIKDSPDLWNPLIIKCVAGLKALRQKEQDGDENPETVLRIRVNGETVERTVTRDDYAKATEESGEESPWEGIDEILLVGGSTKMKCVQEQLKQLTGIKPRRHRDVDFAVGRGAAILAFTPDAWTNKKGLDEDDSGDGESSPGKLTTADIEQKRGGLTRINPHDVVDVGVGVQIEDPRTKKDVNHVVIPAGSMTGEEYEETFNIVEDGQTMVDIVLYKGDSSDVEKVEKLGECSIEGLPAGTKAGEEVTVKLSMDGNGVITGTATHVNSKKKADIKVDYFPKTTEPEAGN